MPKAKKAAVYCRVSTVHQVDKDSLPMQRNDMINYAKYVLNIEDYEVFEDAGYSGKNTDRPAFQGMMTRIHQGEFSHILVWKIDRISRNLLDFATMYEECKKLGVTFVSKNEQFDTSTAMGEAMLKIILVFAELERNMTSERVSATMNARAADGKWNGGRVPYGYSYDKETASFSIFEDEAIVVHRIFDTYEKTQSLVQTATAINDAGITSRRGYRWTPTSIQGILRNPFYLGFLRYNYRDESRTTFSFKDKSEWIMLENHHIAMIDERQFNGCAYWLNKNHRGKGVVHRQRNNVHIFAGMLYCGYCGSLMQSTLSRKQPNGYRPSAYICGEQRVSHNCPNKYTRDDFIGPFIFSYIRNMIQLQQEFIPTLTPKKIQKRLLSGKILSQVKSISPAALSSLYQTLVDSSIGTHTYPLKKLSLKSSSGEIKHGQKKAEIKAEIKRRERALNRLEELYLFSDSPMSQHDYLVKREKLSKELAVHKTNLATLEKDSIFLTSLSDERFIAQASALLLQHSVSAQRIPFKDLVQSIGARPLKEFINTVIKRILVKDGMVIEITFQNGVVHQFNYE